MRKTLIAAVLLAGMSPVMAAYGDDSTGVSAALNRMPAYLLEVPESVTDILIADTGSATMYRFVRSGDRIVEKDQRYMSIGRNGVSKTREWDKKTPLGIYFIVDSLDTSKLHDRYGIAAFPLDYPNAWDRFNKFTGDGIWLHGVDHNNPDRPPLDTDGCLALPNEELRRLVDSIMPLTPVIVARALDWASPTDVDNLRLEFRVALEMWRASLEQGDLSTYLSLYDADFRYRDMNRDAWSSYRGGVFAARTLSGVTLDDVMLVADPETPELYLSRFTQVLATDSGSVTTTKRLYWRRTNGNQWHIISEDAG